MDAEEKKRFNEKAKVGNSIVGTKTLPSKSESTIKVEIAIFKNPFVCAGCEELTHTVFISDLSALFNSADGEPSNSYRLFIPYCEKHLQEKLLNVKINAPRRERGEEKVE